MYRMRPNIVWCLLITFPTAFGYCNIMTKLEDDTEYKILKCGESLHLHEDDVFDIKFQSDQTIDAIMCLNGDTNSRIDFIEKYLRPESFVKEITANSEALGSWKCTFLANNTVKIDAAVDTVRYNGLYYVPEYCSFNIFIEFDIEFKLVRNGGVYYAEENNENEYYFKHEDYIEISCSIPGLQNSLESIGTLSWRHCYNDTIYKNGASRLICLSSSEMETNKVINSNWTLSSNNNENELECIFTDDKNHTETSLKIKFLYIPEEPPQFAVNGYKPYETFTQNKYLYDGKIGETISISCLNSQDRGTLHWVCCKKSKCEPCDGVIHTTNEIYYATTLSEDHVDRTLTCIYTSDSSVLSSKLVFDIQPNDNAVMLSVSQIDFQTGDTIEITCANTKKEKTNIFIVTKDDYMRTHEVIYIPTSHYTYNNSYVVDYATYEMNFTESPVKVVCVFSDGVEVYEAILHRIPTVKTDVNIYAYIGGGVGVGILVILVIITSVCCRRKKEERKDERRKPPNLKHDAPAQLEHVYYTMYN